MSSLRGIRVAVIGGGLAGLVAARELSKQQAVAHVIEARSRVGGRVWTLRDDSFSTEPVELGGEFVDGSHQPLRDLASECGLALTRVIRDGFGLALEVDGRLRIHNTQKNIWRGFRRALADDVEAFEETDCDWNSTIAAALARHSLEDLLRARRASADVRAMAAALRGFFVADSDALSALVGVELAMEEVDPGHVSHFRVKGGNDLLVTALARGKNLMFSFERTVKRIQQTDTEVLITMTEPHGRLETVRADYVVVTVPPPILRTWSLSPPLPAEQRRAMETLSYGFATKAQLRFDTRWWRPSARRHGEAGPRRPRAWGTNLPVGAIWEATESAQGPAVLTLFAGGSASEQLQEILESGGPDAVTGHLRWLGTPEPVREIRSMTWERDPRAKGGYAFFGKSFDPGLRDQLSRAFGRILFAGDHTSREHQGYMNGAVESGHRVVKELAVLEHLHRSIVPDA
jgi:monoamine oxidase